MSLQAKLDQNAKDLMTYTRKMGEFESDMTTSQFNVVEVAVEIYPPTNLEVHSEIDSLIARNSRLEGEVEQLHKEVEALRLTPPEPVTYERK